MLDQEEPASEFVPLSDLEGEQPPPPSPTQEISEKDNLAAVFRRDELKKIGAKVCSKFSADVSSRADRMKKLKLLQDAYAMKAKPKSFPFHNAANVMTPTVAGPQLQIQARLFDMTWPATGKVFYAIAGSAEEMSIAGVAETFANSYVRYKMPYMSQGLDDTLHQMCLYGSAFRRTYWDAYERKVRSDWIPIDDFVVAATQRSQDPSMSDVPRYTMVHRMSATDIDNYILDGIFTLDPEGKEKLKKSTADTALTDFGAATAKIDGVASGEADEDSLRQVLEQHCRWQMPKDGRHPAFDGRSHYVMITVDAATEEVLRITLREEDDPDDKRRFDRQMQAFEQYMQQKAVVEAAQMAQLQAQLAPPPPMDATMDPGMAPMGPPDASGPPEMGGMDVAGPPGSDAFGAMVDRAGPLPTGGMASAEPPPVPEMPAPVNPPTPIRKRQICFFTHYRCFPSEGFYGLGYGDMLYGLSLALNTTINQHIDGITLRNAKPMFMSRQVRMQRGAVNVQPGEAIEVDGPVSAIRDAIMFLDPPDNDPSTVPLIKMMDGMKDAISGSSDMMSGQAPGSNQTKVGMQILAEQANLPISVLGRRVKEAFRHELDKIWRCWGVFLEDDEITDVVNEAGLPDKVQIGRWMFSPNARVVPAADPRIRSQRMEDHMALVQYVMNNPMLQDPSVGAPIVRALTEQGFRLFPDGDKLLALLPPPKPPGPPPPPPPKPQYEENADFLRGKDNPVHPDDDDDAHADDLMLFLQSPPAQAMDKVGRDMAERHLRFHKAAAISKKGKQYDEQRQQELSGPGPGGPPPMDGPPGNPPPGGPPGGGM